MTSSAKNLLDDITTEQSTSLLVRTSFMPSDISLATFSKFKMNIHSSIVSQSLFLLSVLIFDSFCDLKVDITLY